MALGEIGLCLGSSFCWVRSKVRERESGFVMRVRLWSENGIVSRGSVFE